MQKKYYALLIFLLSISLIFSACQTPKNSDKTLKIAIESEITSINSLTVSEASNSQLIGNIIEGLTTYGKNGEIVGAMANSWQISDDALTYTFKLREAQWENKTAVTAHDFVFAWQMMSQLPDAAYKQFLKKFKNGEAVLAQQQPVTSLGVKALDDKTLQVELIQPIPYLLELTAFPPFYPVNQQFYHSVKEQGYGTSKETVLANGPFTLSDFSGTTGYTLNRNPKYWDADKVKLEAVHVQVIKQAETRSVLFDQGELDHLMLNTDLYQKYQNSNEKIITEFEPRIAYMYLSGTTKSPAPLLANKNFRAAIAHAIDREKMTTNILTDGSVAANYLIPRDFLAIDGKDFRDFNTTLPKNIFSLNKAKNYLEEAKKQLGHIPLEFTLTTSDLEMNKNLYQNIAFQIEENLPDIKVNLTFIPQATYYADLRKFDTPAASGGWVAGYKDPSTFFDVFLPNAPQNYAQYNNPQYTKLIAETDSATLAFDTKTRFEKFSQAETILINDYVIIPLYQKGQRSIVKPYVKNLTLSQTIPAYFYKYVELS